MAVTVNNSSPLMDGQQASPWAVYNAGMVIIDGLLLSNAAFNADFETRLGTGKSGGRTLPGGSGSGEDLTLLSTTHATKGQIFFGTDSVFDAAHQRWGLGTQNPSFDISLGGEVSRIVSM